MGNADGLLGLALVGSALFVAYKVVEGREPDTVATQDSTLRPVILIDKTGGHLVNAQGDKLELSTTTHPDTGHTGDFEYKIIVYNDTMRRYSAKGERGFTIFPYLPKETPPAIMTGLSNHGGNHQVARHGYWGNYFIYESTPKGNLTLSLKTTGTGDATYTSRKLYAKTVADNEHGVFVELRFEEPVLGGLGYLMEQAMW